MKQLNSAATDFWQQLKDLQAFENRARPKVHQIVADICHDVQTRGDAAVIEYTNRFDGMSATSMADLTLSPFVRKPRLSSCQKNVQAALTTAARRIEDYHQHQKQSSWQYTDADGTVLGQQITALDRVGIYVPGGSSYPSSVMMNAMPAHVAGVQANHHGRAHTERRTQRHRFGSRLCGRRDPTHRGGAQAVAALAYGTETIPQVDKITGPGNAFVAAAKRRVFGIVGIDMVAGPERDFGDCRWLYPCRLGGDGFVQPSRTRRNRPIHFGFHSATYAALAQRRWFH